MKVLLVEDDENKRMQIVELVKTVRPGWEIVSARSYQSGLKLLLRDRFDLILLDMTIPTYDIGPEDDGGRPQPYGGRELLRQMGRRGLRSPVIVVTQFDRFGERGDALTLAELDADSRSEHGDIYWGSIYYNGAVDTWKGELIEKMDRLSKGEGS